MRTSACAFAVLVVATVATSAQRAMPDHGNGRYSLVPRGEEFLRLDSRTGDVSVCAWRGAGWACVGLPDDRAAYEVEIGRLMQENERLKRQLSARERASREAAKPDQSQAATALPPIAAPPSPPKQESPSERPRAPATAAAPDARADPASVPTPALPPPSVPELAPAPSLSPPPPAEPRPRSPPSPEIRAPGTPSVTAPPPQAPSGSQAGKGAAPGGQEEGALDRALAVFERAWRQLVDAVRRRP